jgi:hypothetical protein
MEFEDGIVAASAVRASFRIVSAEPLPPFVPRQAAARMRGLRTA